jgi:hypothetical protein
MRAEEERHKGSLTPIKTQPYIYIHDSVVSHVK